MRTQDDSILMLTPCFVPNARVDLVAPERPQIGGILRLGMAVPREGKQGGCKGQAAGRNRLPRTR